MASKASRYMQRLQRLRRDNLRGAQPPIHHDRQKQKNRQITRIEEARSAQHPNEASHPGHNNTQQQPQRPEGEEQP